MSGNVRMPFFVGANQFVIVGIGDLASVALAARANNCQIPDSAAHGTQ
jgi:hypothetical protein